MKHLEPPRAAFRARFKGFDLEAAQAAGPGVGTEPVEDRHGTSRERRTPKVPGLAKSGRRLPRRVVRAPAAAVILGERARGAAERGTPALTPVDASGQPAVSLTPNDAGPLPVTGPGGGSGAGRGRAGGSRLRFRDAEQRG